MSKMSCKEVFAELSDYLDEELSPELRRELEAHLAECRTCEIVYDSMHKSVRLVTATRSFDLSGSVAQRLLARIRAKLQPNPDAPGSEEA